MIPPHNGPITPPASADAPISLAGAHGPPSTLHTTPVTGPCGE